MTKHKFPEIQTEKLLLHRLEKSDWKAVSFLRSDKKVNEFVKRSSAESKENALEFITKINAGIENRELYYWKISEKFQHEMIGSICLWNFSNDNKIAEVGYDLMPKYQGQGIMNESLESVIKYGFQKLNLVLIEAYTHSKNASSAKLLKKNGFSIVEGKKDAHNIDNLVYELRKSATNNVYC